MGVQCSSTCGKTVTDNLSSSLLFSDFWSSIKRTSRNDNLLSHKFRANLSCPLEYDVETMEAVVHLWCINCLSMSRWQKLDRHLKNQLIKDFLNTLYCTSHAFDEIFLLLFTNSKSRSFILGNHDRLISSNELRDIVVDILVYSVNAGLKYYTHVNGQKCLESIADFPLKTFSLCPCTKRPLYVAMYLSRPDIVQILLKNGARMPYEDICNCMENSRHPLRNVLDVLKVTYESKRKDDPSISVRTRRNILSLKLILVDVSHCSTLWTTILDTLRNLSDIEKYDNVPSLKHIVRTRIRHVMRRNRFFCHPHVWKILCLPQTLISYLNLDDYSDQIPQI